ncbi:DUF3182 family protein [Pusillimonas sp.]|uniref:DUF3182 family protein n=1 Tax=Pusillimonas sp. TaxID=3040095 RepID=UPI0037C9DCB5
MAATPHLAARKSKYRIAVAFPRRQNSSRHEVASQDALARKLADVLQLDFVQDYQPEAMLSSGGIYYVPAQTLVRVNAMHGAPPYFQDIQDAEDLFGGLVPYEFVATKAITHGLLNPGAAAPEGWSHDFGQQVAHATLAGITVFSMTDARLAGIRLLALGPIRIKPVQASGGRGQLVISDRRQLDQALAGQNDDELAKWGLVLEEHLQDVETYSVGQARAGGVELSYVGTQSLTPDNEAQPVYGGSALLCVRGGYEDLMALPLDEPQRQAVRLARQYDAAAQRCWPALLASRRNYDVARGKDARGRIKMGVLEQSWRAGGASFAEACALGAFRAEPKRAVAKAYTCERYGKGYRPPDTVQIIYQGDDPATGFITKYGAIEPHGHP